MIRTKPTTGHTPDCTFCFIDVKDENGTILTWDIPSKHMPQILNNLQYHSIQRDRAGEILTVLSVRLKTRLWCSE